MKWLRNAEDSKEDKIKNTNDLISELGGEDTVIKAIKEIDKESLSKTTVKFAKGKYFTAKTLLLIGLLTGILWQTPQEIQANPKQYEALVSEVVEINYGVSKKK